MKTRYGFVSNSSSSSFVIAIDSKIKSAEELKPLLFKDYDSFITYAGE